MWGMSITMIRKSFMSVIQHWEYLPIYTNMLIYPELLQNQQPLWVIVRGLALQDHQDMTEVYWITLKLSYLPGQHIYRYKKIRLYQKHHLRHQAIPIQSTISCDVFATNLPWACFLVWFLLQLLVVHWREAIATSRPWVIEDDRSKVMEGKARLYCVCDLIWVFP